MSNWTLFSNHGHVLVCLARDSEARLRDVAAAVGITERAVQKIVRDLQQSGMISVSKQGRRNQYRIHRKAGLRHELEADSTIGGLIDFVSGKIKTVSVAKKPTESASVADLNKAQKSVESAPINIAREPVEPAPPAQVESVAVKQKEAADTDQVAKQKEAADLRQVDKQKDAADTDQDVKQKEAADAGKAAATKEKAAQKAKEKSEIEKQQGSLF